MLFEYEYQDLNIKIDIVLYAKNKIKESNCYVTGKNWI